MTRTIQAGWSRSLALFALLMVIGSTAVAAQAEDEADGAAPVDPAASAEPQATPFPTFDPATLTIRTELLADGFASPVYVTADGTGSGCLYVVEQAGTVRIFKDGLIRPEPYLDISKSVQLNAEQGLHSIAFHPDFRRNQRFYVHYNDTKNRTRIDEFKGRACRGTARAKPSKRLLTLEQPVVNNNGGWIGFGPDDLLYIPLGDGGGVSPGDPTGVGQNKATLLSKVLRIDVDARKRYAIPKSNPFAKKRRGFARETWARGLRDPRRSSFDSATGDLWIGDVGQDRFEEVNRIPRGTAAMNFGWSDMEGFACHNLVECDPTLYDLPIHTYDSTQPQCGIVGGYVYRGEAIPDLDGVYLFSDRCSGFVWGLDADAVGAGEEATTHLLLDAPQGFVSFGQDDAGELYLVALDGRLFRIEAEATGL